MVQMTYLVMHRAYNVQGVGMEGKATFKMTSGHNEVSMDIALTNAQMAVIIQAVGDSIKELAAKQAHAFTQEANAITSQLLEHKEE